ncbi:MAG: aerobic respiration control sensor protein ArcB [Methanoregula sp. PtaU1.Bin051]|nr:MAG: aerobic respiration control sensor protein ArcB [Methanoregula sp. PtaU1.Bin051]
MKSPLTGGRTLIPVLYVDDESDLLEVGRLFLEEDGKFSVDTFTSAKEALEAVKVRRYDAIISDYRMHDMDGIEFLKAVRCIAGDVPFILFTGRGREEVVIEAINNGADFYLQKGGDSEALFAELIHKIKKAIERRQALFDLRNSEQRLADIINFLPDATFAINTSGIVIAWNRAMEVMTGTNAADFLGKGGYEYAIPFYGTRRPILIDLVLAPDERFEREKYLYATREGTTLTAETVVVKPDGSTVNLWGKASRLYDKNGNLAGAIESIRDVTDLRRAEEAIRESEERFRAIIETSPDIIWEIDTEGMFRYISQRATEIIGYRPEELVGQSIATLIPENTRPYIMQELARHGRSKGSLFTIEVPVLHKEGHNLLIEIRSSPFTDEDGVMIGHRGMARDITERKKAREELRGAYEQLNAADGELRRQYKELVQSELQIRESEGRFRSIVETSPDMIWEIDMQGMFRYISPRVTEILGYFPEELIGRSVTNLLTDEARPYIMERIARDGASEESMFTFEVPARHKDGRDLVIEIRSSLFTDSDRNVTGFRGVARDVTEKKKSEEVVRRARRKLTLMTGITRHDILNNIMAVLGLLRQVKKDSPVPEMTAFIEKLERRTKLIRQQIEFTRIYEKLGTQDPCWQDLHALISRLQVPFGIALSDTSAGIEILSDMMLWNVFENLLDNSMRHGGDVTEIKISTWETGSGLVVMYEDNGIGIPADEKEKIFERGYGKNTGLGLFLVREILALTGIAIHETGQPGRGVRFEMAIPKGSYRFTKSI